MRMALECLQRRFRRRVLQPDRSIVRARRQLLTVRREGDGADPMRMTLERLQRRFRRVPQPGRSVDE
jgi:hypothetical protein